MSTTPVHFRSGRTGRGPAFVSDRSGSPHARFMRLTSYALAPLGVVAAWIFAGIAGKPLDGARAELGHPFAVFALIAFAVIGMTHAHRGMCEIIEDYVHDETLKARALVANKWTAIAIAAIWVAALLFIAVSK